MVKNPQLVVIDSNVVISALVFGGNPKLVLLLAISKQIQSVVSQFIFFEIDKALRIKFQFSTGDRKLLFEKYKNASKKVELMKSKINVSRDKKDDAILEAAVEGKCAYIITGDKDLLVLKKYKNIKILSAKEFLEVFKSQV
jgi:putative PIN family toxin of toxin-antitoxin system